MKSIKDIPDKMKVLNLKSVGELVYEEKDTPKVAQGEVLVNIKS